MSVDRRKAKKLKIGDEVIAPKVGINEPKKITGIITSDKRAKTKVPLFSLDCGKLITYRLLEIPSCDQS